MENRLYPVIHVRSHHHAIESARIALDSEADGVFLINMGDISNELLYEAFMDTYYLFSDEFEVGVNFLTPLNQIPVNIPIGSMLWSDSMDGYDNKKIDISTVSFYIPYAFKYQPQPKVVGSIENLQWVEARGDVITTSGNRTGNPPSLEKIQAIYNVATKPLAIASGISIDNVDQFKPYVRDFLVGSSIGYHTLIPAKVKKLARRIHE